VRTPNSILPIFLSSRCLQDIICATAEFRSNVSHSTAPYHEHPLILKDSRRSVQAIEIGRSKEHLHLNLELKETWKQEHGYDVSALANKIDQPTSFLVVGITDDGNPMGRDENWAKKTEEVISQHVNQYLDPRQTCKAISCRQTNQGLIVVITIQNAGEVAYWSEHAYSAPGTTTQRMEPGEILKLRIQLPGLIDYSKQSHRSAYNEGLIRRFTSDVIARQHPTEIEGLTGRTPPDILRRLGLFERQAARLLFGNASYRLVRYDNQQRPISNQKLQGLISLLFPEFIKGLCRDRDGHLSEPALKEALANAVAHAAYFENDGEIMVEVFPDCITVSNLCIKKSTYFANRWFPAATRP
jgi:predicted HTH transcriptional regulator